MMDREQGSAVVEFVMILPAVVLVLLAVAEVTVVARTQLELSHAAREGVRVAATTPDTIRAVEAALALLGPGDAGLARVSVTRPSTVGENAVVEVSVPHRLPVIGLSVTLRARSIMRVEL